MATRIEALAGEMLGQTPLRRVGRAPKSLLVYRTSMPFKKLATEEHFFVDGSKVQVEVLGQGQQFVGFGIHPATGQEYQWTDRSPLDVNWEALPSVTSEQVGPVVCSESTSAGWRSPPLAIKSRWIVAVARSVSVPAALPG